MCNTSLLNMRKIVKLYTTHLLFKLQISKVEGIEQEIEKETEPELEQELDKEEIPLSSVEYDLPVNIANNFHISTNKFLSINS